MKNTETAGPDTFLPLKPAWFHVLLALGDEPRHGYAIGRAVEELTDGSVRLWPASLYGTIHHLTKEGLLERLADVAEEGDDPRRRYYGLTELGRRVLAAETARLRQLVTAAERTRAFGST